ncbi:MAG: SCP2 sterol-binding domain-containing protein [Anaerolineae bacterium]
MAIEFATEAWIQALMAELNQSERYREAAKNWEGDFYFVINQGEGVPQDTYLYMDLWHGECRAASLVKDASEKQPAFVLSAPLAIWKKVIGKKLDPIRGLMTRQLKLEGNMMKIMKTPKAAIELVECCTRLDTSWPA